MKFAIVVIFSISLIIVSAGDTRNLESVFEWNFLDFVWQSQEQRQSYIDSNKYNSSNIVPIDVDVAKDGRIFLTIIRDQGVPASLTTVSNERSPSGNLLTPYPNWSWYTNDNCDGIISVYRITIDDCNRLWALDNGYIGDNYTCPAQLLAFDLATNSLVNRIKIPFNVSHNQQSVGKLVTPVVELKKNSCDVENVFMADVDGMGLVVWNEARLFRLNAKVYNPDPSQTNVSIAGEDFQLRDGIFGMALSPSSPLDEGRDLFFRPFASLAMYAADSRVISRSIHGDAIKYMQSPDMLPSQGTAMAFSSDGILFFGLTREIAIGCWNRYTDLRRENVDIAIRDPYRLQFVSGLKILPARRIRRREEIWAVTNRFQKIMNGSQSLREINYRILKIPVHEAIFRTKCR